MRCCMFFPETNSVEAFGFQVEPSLLFEWNQGEDKQVIGQTELLPVLCSRRLWAPRIRGKDVLLFVDNMSALDGLIKGDSEAVGSKEILTAIVQDDMLCDTNTWYARVPSFSNISDGPSRLSFTEFLSLPNSKIVSSQIIASLTHKQVSEGEACSARAEF